jgi:2-polyprenyl-3-methyl-5-hydroxy-6-metoxy-1,4-benzoquinol methylase
MHTYDEVTFRHLRSCGIARGWRCWAVHPDGPDVPRWMAEHVGSSGFVLATGPALTWTERLAGCHVMAHDIATDEPPDDGFDVIHARRVLAHLPGRDAALDRMVRALRPGGILLVEEDDHLLVAQPCAGRSDDARRANRIREDVLDLLAARGADLTYGRKLPRLLRERGLRDIGAEGVIAVAGPFAQAAEMAQVQGLADALAARGEIDTEDIHQHLAAMTASRLDVTAAPFISVWGRKPKDSAYVYGQSDRRAELDRLRRLEAIADPATLATFDHIGVAPGWRCLEVGAGAGSIARALASRVGTAGHVVATDIDLQFLAHHAGANLEVRRADVLADELEPGAYDLVHTRHLVAHVAARADEVIERLAGAVAPGGWLVVEDVDLSTPMLVAGSDADQQAFAAVYQAFESVLRARGGDAHIGRRLPLLVERSGLVDIEVNATVAYSRSGDDATAMMLGSLTAVRPALIDAGVAPDALDRVTALLQGPEHRAFGPINVTVTARRPPADGS